MAQALGWQLRLQTQRAGSAGSPGAGHHLWPGAHSAHQLSLAGVKQQLEMVRPGLGILSVFICLRGTKKDLGLQATNHYVYFDTDMDKA